MKRIETYILLIALLYISCNTYSQEDNICPSNAITINLNAEAFSGLEFGYQHRIQLAAQHPTLYASFNFPVFLTIKQKNLDTWEMNAGIANRLTANDKLLLVSRLNVFTRKHKQILGTFFPIGLDLKMTPSLETKSGYFGFQLDYTQLLVTHITNSDLVKRSYMDIIDVNGNTYISEPKDGWYSLTGNYLKYGIETMFGISEKTDLYFDLGIIQYFSKYTKGFDSMMYGQVPFFMDLQFQIGL